MTLRQYSRPCNVATVTSDCNTTVLILHRDLGNEAAIPVLHYSHTLYTSGSQCTLHKLLCSISQLHNINCLAKHIRCVANISATATYCST